MDYTCKATRRNGKQCRQTTKLDTDGYCRYHQSPKYKPASSTVTLIAPTTAPTPKPIATMTPSTDETECNVCCSEFPSDQSWRLMGFGCCAFKLCRKCAVKVDKCPGCRTDMPILQRPSNRVPSYVTEGDHQVAAELDAQLNSSSRSTVITSSPVPEWVVLHNKWLHASIPAKRRAVLRFNLLIDGSQVEIGRLFNALNGRSKSSRGYNVVDLKHIAYQLRVPGEYYPRSGGRDDYTKFIVTKLVSALV